MASETPQFEASSVPPPSAPGVEGVQISTAQRARLLTRLVLGTGVSDQDGQPTAAALEAAGMLHTCVGMIVSADPNVSAEGVVALETMVPILGRLRRSEAMTPDDAGHLAIQLDLLARDRISGEIPEAPGLAGAYQGAAILRALAKIAPGQRTPSLMNSLARATQEYPQALGPGLLCDVLDPRQPGSLTVMQTAMLTAAMMPRPSTPPRAIVAAAITRMSGGSVPATDESNEWTRALAQRTDVQGEIFAASVLQHPGLSANEAGRLVAAMARRDSGRADERRQTAIEYTLDSLRTRLGHGNDQSINPGNIAAAIIETSDPAKQLATLFSTRTLNSAAGRGDEGADQIAYAMLQAGIVEPSHLSSPEAAIAATAANLTPESRDPDEHLEPLTLSEQIARRLASGLARVTATVGDAAQWAREIGQKWTRLSPGPMRTRALSALTLAFELLADGRLPFSRPDLLNRLLRRAAHPEIADQGMEPHQAEFEGTLDRVAAAPFALPIGVGAEPAMLNVEFVPGWRSGVSMDELERARRQPEWKLSQVTNWLDPNSVAVLADGELCGWIKPDPATNTITTHVKPVPGSDRDESKQHEARAMGAVLSAVALSVAADSRMAVEGERLNESIGMLAEMSGNGVLQAFAAQGAERASAPEVQRLAASAGWRAVTPGIEMDVQPVEESESEGAEVIEAERVEPEEPTSEVAPHSTSRRGR